MKKPRILVIEDEKEFRMLMKKELRIAGYDVITAADGEEGINKAKELKPDLVISDIQMPRKDGYEVLRELREDLHLNQTPIIVLTVLEEFENVKEAYDYEADFYIGKPVKFAELLKNIRILLEISKSRKE